MAQETDAIPYDVPGVELGHVAVEIAGLREIGPLPLMIAGGVVGAKSRTNGLEHVRELAA